MFYHGNRAHSKPYAQNDCVFQPFTKEDILPYRTMSQQVRFDHVLAYEYLKNLPGLEALNGQDRYVMYKYIFMGNLLIYFYLLQQEYRLLLPRRRFP